MLVACRPAPKVEEAKAAVESYFAVRGYPVTEISINNIQPLTDGEKTYMGVPSFVVEIDRLVLSVDGQAQEFTGVRLMLKESRTPGERYVVSDITGVPLP